MLNDSSDETHLHWQRCVLTPPLVLSTIQVFVKGIPGRTAGYNVCPSTTVDALKVLIFNREGIPTELQRLSHNCTILEGPRSLDDQGVTAEAEVKLLLRLRGGMAKIKKEKVDTSASNKATKKAKAKILSKTAGPKKLTKSQKKQRNRVEGFPTALRLKRLENFARAVETLREQSLESGGSAKDVAAQLQAISDRHCIEDVLMRWKPDALELEKMEAQKMFRISQGRRQRAEAFRRRIWPGPEHDVQKIKQEHGDDDGHILLEEAGIGGQYIKQDASLPLSDFEAQASETRNTIGQQALAYRPRPALSAAQSWPPHPPADKSYNSYDAYIPPPPPPDHALPGSPTGFFMPSDDELMETHIRGASEKGSHADASYAQWLQEQVAKMALRSGALQAREADFA